VTFWFGWHGFFPRSEVWRPWRPLPRIALEPPQAVEVQEPDDPLVGFHEAPRLQIMQDDVHRLAGQSDQAGEISLTVPHAVFVGQIEQRAGDSATKLSTAHLEVTAYPSDSAIAPGNRITLALDIVPRRGMHVYAPGAAGDRVIALQLEPQPLVRALSAKYPPSQIYFFKPLNERVPVYEKPFTLLQDIELDGAPNAQAALRGKDSFTVAARLEYQACDAKICYEPESIPLSWTFTLRPLILERPVQAPPRR